MGANTPRPPARQPLVDKEMAQAIIEGALDAFVQTDERMVRLCLDRAIDHQGDPIRRHIRCFPMSSGF